MSNTDANFIETLVVGAGPVGLTMASELARYGVRCRIIDKSPTPSQVSKALGIQARTLEVFEDMGVIQPFLNEGLRMEGVNLYDATKQLAEIRLENIDLSDLPYPFGMLLPQSHTERILMAHAATLGVSVERPKELLHFAQDAEGITVTLRCADGTEERIRTHWLLGCDGASSSVRGLLGIPFEGETYKEAFWAADLTVATDLPSNIIHTVWHPDGMMMIFPLFPERRLFRFAADVMVDVPQGERPAPPTFEQMLAVIQHRCPFTLNVRDPEWLSAFRIHHRKIKQYRHGRVFLAGDAAHIHSPMGGQGMNTGIQDAYNLAWKLALVQRGYGSEVLLESYQNEREPVATELLEMTNRMTKMAKTRNPLIQKIRNRVVPFIAGTEAVQQKVMRGIAEVNINYRGTPLVHEDWAGGGDLEAGDRAPDAECFNTSTGGTERIFEALTDKRYMLLLFTGTNATAADHRSLRRIAWEIRNDYGNCIETRFITPSGTSGEDLQHEDTATLVDALGYAYERYEVNQPSAVLVRPDGYIAYRSAPATIEDLLSYLYRIFPQPTAAKRSERKESELSEA
jgi:2-polyprenyl-6-methoxyphenol hydroxylase-like FAD-dependent oxidoreductase